MESISSTDPRGPRPASPDTVAQVSDVSGSEVIRLDDENFEEHHAPTATPTITPPLATTSPWLPYTLRWIPLCLILSFCLLLDFAVVVVHIISSKNFGLAEDDGSTAIAIGSKFVPTLLAVVFSLLATVLLDDVKRTEPFARMASSAGATAEQSLTWTANTWWPFPSPLGKGKLPLFSATLVFVLGSLVVSPLSSTLLATQVVVFDEQQSFKQLNLGSLMPIQPAPVATTYFRTISNILRNVSTSAWITDDYVVLPFWPGNLSTIPLSPILSGEVETWSARTTIFSVDLNCKPIEFRLNNLVPSSAIGDANFSITLASQSGCTIDLEFGNFSTEASLLESNVDNYGGAGTHDLGNGEPKYSIHGCSENEILISSTEWGYAHLRDNVSGPSFKNLSASGQACQNTYYVGNATASVTMGPGQSRIAVNAAEYHLTKKPIAAAIVNTTAFDSIFFDSNWTIHLAAANRESFLHFAGPANLLATLYQFSPEQVIADASIAQNMQRIRKQFFAELLHNSFELMTVANAVDLPGSVITTSPRVVVVPGVAITLEVVLSLLCILLMTILYTTRPSRRFLRLGVDPATVVGVAKLLSNNPPTLTAFTESSNGTSINLNQSLSKFHFTLAEGQIEVVEKAALKDPPGDHRARGRFYNESLEDGSANRPKNHKAFSLCHLSLLLVLLSLTLAAIAKLYQLAQSEGLYNTIFVYNINISIGGSRLGAINPASLLTTLTAVIISNWWGSFDNTLREVQPYLALAKSPVSGYRGVAISYKSSYLLWVAYRAARRSHWVLLLVSTGTFLAQILTVAMSSLWTRDPGALTELITVPRALELRSVPIIVRDQSPNRYQLVSDGLVVDSLLSNLTTSWMYGATTQLTLQGPDPPWSVDGWSFVPSALNITASPYIQRTGNSSELSFLSINVTIQSPAVRARLECSPYNLIDNEAQWLTKWDLTDKTNWNRTANPRNLTIGFELGLRGDGRYDNSFYPEESSWGGKRTSFFVNDRRLNCCENRTTESVGLASIGYWSANLAPDSFYPYIAETWPTNFTVKWIRGRPLEGIMGAGEQPNDIEKHLIWVEQPQMVALNCQPIIETANSQVTVDVDTGRVISYEILEVPRVDREAWNHPWVVHRHGFDSYSPHGDFAATRSLIYLPEINVTVSHGVLFITGLLGVADMSSIMGEYIGHEQERFGTEDIQEQTFNFRQPGLNVDYMTYAMLSLVNFDHQQLLDAATLERTANRTFSTMYQHFVNNDVSLTAGGHAYQPLGEKLPDIGDRLERRRRDIKDTTTANTTGRQEIIMQISRPVELLNISTPAAWICMVILAYLIVSCSVLIVASRQYNRLLPVPTTTIADTAALVAGSTKLLKLSRLRSTSSIKSDGNILAKLGWFNDAEGQKRWGIELSDGDGETNRASLDSIG
ncbi:hypothetical protein NUW58_g264 [Xylaria curta]|uniref:Uncharacterized protein n=1 Tax=Xylaria curta TaxID=42375 RepID=A0ACC1PRI9_9PEZI|nr:hypothetical protein NUW58_g264 [Xylaria curta]